MYLIFEAYENVVEFILSAAYCRFFSLSPIVYLEKQTKQPLPNDNELQINLFCFFPFFTNTADERLIATFSLFKLNRLKQTTPVKLMEIKHPVASNQSINAILLFFIQLNGAYVIDLVFIMQTSLNAIELSCFPSRDLIVHFKNIIHSSPPPPPPSPLLKTTCCAYNSAQ